MFYFIPIKLKNLFMCQCFTDIIRSFSKLKIDDDKIILICKILCKYYFTVKQFNKSDLLIVNNNFSSFLFK